MQQKTAKYGDEDDGDDLPENRVNPKVEQRHGVRLVGPDGGRVEPPQRFVQVHHFVHVRGQRVGNRENDGGDVRHHDDVNG